MFKSGLVSISFRQLEAERIIENVAKAELEAIEWGSDVHVPVGNETLARSIGQRTREAGLEVASYGSYYRLEEGLEAFKAVLSTALELGAPTIRVWAGSQASRGASEDYRSQITENTLKAADLIMGTGTKIAFEYHGNTLTDTMASTARLFDACHHNHIRTYWQPDVHLSVDDQNQSLLAIQSKLANLHVFNWVLEGGYVVRKPLAEGLRRWTELLAMIQIKEIPIGDHYAMIEFVKGDTLAQFHQDAKALREILKQARSSRAQLL